MTSKGIVPSSVGMFVGVAAAILFALLPSAWGGGVDEDCCWAPTETPAECFLDLALTQPVACGTECYEEGGLILPIVCVPDAGAVCTQCDCDDFNGGVSPESPEACSDGQDNDCDGLVDASDPDCEGGGIYPPEQVTATAENSFSGAFTPDKTINTDCTWNNVWINEITDVLPTWIQWEFPAAHTLSKVTLVHSSYGEQSPFTYLIQDYEVQVSSDPDCGTGVGFATVAANTGNNIVREVQETILNPAASAKCVRINALYPSYVTGDYVGGECPTSEACDEQNWIALSAFQAYENGTGEPLIDHPCVGAPTPVCGNNVQDAGEECDGTDDAACPGECGTDCTCGGPLCGNNVMEAGEECDGTDDAACPGLCGLDCACGGPCADFVNPTATVAIHVSETTKAHWSSLGGPHAAWQPWHVYGFLMEQLRSDGTPFDVVSDALIEAGSLMEGASPKYAILFSLANDCISDAAAAQIEAFVSAGGHAFVGSTSWTRDESCALRGGGAGGGAIYTPVEVTATAENSFDEDLVPDNTIDTDCDNQWINSMDDPQDALPTWLQYEFPATHTLAKVVVQHSDWNPTVHYLIEDYEVQVSTDPDCGTGVGFSTVAINTGNEILGEIQETILSPPAAARCVRLNALSSYLTGTYPPDYDMSEWVGLSSFQAIEDVTGNPLIDHPCAWSGSPTLPYEFALSTEMGLTAGSPILIGDLKRTGVVNSLVSHLYNDTDVRGWKLALSSGADCADHPSHWAQQVAASTATVLATTSTNAPILTVKNHGAGRFIYNSEFNPLAGYSMHTIANFVYGFYRKAIDEAHAATGLPNVRLGTWPWPYVAGFITRHDHRANLGFDGVSGTSDDALVAEIEAAYGVKGGYFQNAGSDLPNSGQPCTDASFGNTCDTVAQDNVLYMDSLGAEFGIHYPTVGSLDRLQAYLGFRPTIYVASGGCGMRDTLKQTLINLGIVTKGDVAFGAHPHFALRIDTAAEYGDTARWPLVDIPATSYYGKGGYAGNIFAGWISSNPPTCNNDGVVRPCMEKAVDLQYGLGGVINLYDHIGDSGSAFNPTPTEYEAYIAYSQSLADVLTTSTLEIYEWWLRRDPVRVATSWVTSPAPRVTVDLSCTDDAGPFSVEVDLPFSGDLTVRVDGVPTSSYELAGNRIRVQAPSPSQVEVSAGECTEDNDCSDGDPCNGTETCNLGSYECEPGTNAPLSTPCEADGDLCTNDHCDGSGLCVFESEVVCQAADPPCEGGQECNPSTGACDPLPDAPLSTPCEADADLCTNDHCDGNGSCELESTVSCPGPVGACDGGQVCSPATGLCVEAADPAVGTPCDADADLCTNDQCDGAGLCVFDSDVVCQAADPPCEGGEECNPSTGACDPLPDAPLSTPCEADGDLCTNDHCDGNGSCVNLDSVSCPGPTAECDGGQACNPTTGLCEEEPDPALGTPCDADADLCTNDQCDGSGGCVFDSDVVCTDQNVCTTDSCIPATGCQYDADPGCMEAPLPGLRLVIKNLPVESKNRIVFVAKDPQIAIGASGSSSDPSCSGATGGGGTLVVSSETSGESVSIPLPCQNWKAIGTPVKPGYKYLDADLSEGPCKVVLIRAGKVVKSRCLGRGPHALGYDLQFGQAEAPVKVKLTTGNSAHYCAELGGTIRKDGSDGTTFLAKGSPAPSGCEE